MTLVGRIRVPQLWHGYNIDSHNIRRRMKLAHSPLWKHLPAISHFYIIKCFPIKLCYLSCIHSLMVLRIFVNCWWKIIMFQRFSQYWYQNWGTLVVTVVCGIHCKNSKYFAFYIISHLQVSIKYLAISLRVMQTHGSQILSHTYHDAKHNNLFFIVSR